MPIGISTESILFKVRHPERSALALRIYVFPGLSNSSNKEDRLTSKVYQEVILVMHSFPCGILILGVEGRRTLLRACRCS